MWTTRLRHAEGGGTIQMTTVRTIHTANATCLFVTILRTFAGTYLLGDQREGVRGEIQKLVDEDAELDEDDDE